VCACACVCACISNGAQASSSTSAHMLKHTCMDAATAQDVVANDPATCILYFKLAWLHKRGEDCGRHMTA
jgi:hypothetical protein